MRLAPLLLLAACAAPEEGGLYFEGFDVGATIEGWDVDVAQRFTDGDGHVEGRLVGDFEELRRGAYVTARFRRASPGELRIARAEERQVGALLAIVEALQGQEESVALIQIRCSDDKCGRVWHASDAEVEYICPKCFKPGRPIR